MRKEFNYDEFRRIVDDSGYEEAMNYFKNSNLLFKEKLELIARLENISDSTKRISSLIANPKLNTNEKKNIADFLMVLKSDYINVMKSFYNKDERLVYDILSKSLEKRMKIYELTKASRNRAGLTDELR